MLQMHRSVPAQNLPDFAKSFKIFTFKWKNSCIWTSFTTFDAHSYFSILLRTIAKPEILSAQENQHLDNVSWHIPPAPVSCWHFNKLPDYWNFACEGVLCDRMIWSVYQPPLDGPRNVPIFLCLLSPGRSGVALAGAVPKLTKIYKQQ